MIPPDNMRMTWLDYACCAVVVLVMIAMLAMVAWATVLP